MLQSKRALILASSQGLGFAIASELRNQGAEVILHARQSCRLAAAAEALRCQHAAWDLSLPAATERGVQDVEARFGPLDVLVTNCGGPTKAQFVDTSSAAWEEGYQQIFNSVIEAVRACAPGMMERRSGRIILNLSIAAREAIEGLSISSAFRSGLIGLTKALSREFAPSGVTVNAILPGFIATARLAQLGASPASLSRQIPMQRVGEPEDVARLATFIASDAASYITGQAIACDGGQLRGI